jgi:hypothetical protein
MSGTCTNIEQYKWDGEACYLRMINNIKKYIKISEITRADQVSLSLSLSLSDDLWKTTY